MSPHERDIGERVRKFGATTRTGREIKSGEGDEVGVQMTHLGKGKVKLYFPEQKTSMIITLPKNLWGRKDISKEQVALETTRMGLNLLPESQGIDQSWYSTKEEEGIKNLPGNREGDYEAALRWACATLKGSGWSAEKIAKYWVENNPQIRTGISLATLSKESVKSYTEQLRGIYLHFFRSNNDSPK